MTTQHPPVKTLCLSSGQLFLLIPLYFTSPSKLEGRKKIILQLRDGSYPWLLVRQQTLVQVGEGSIHRLPDPLAGRVALPRLSVRHAVVPVRLHGRLQRHELGRRHFYATTAAPHRHRLGTTQHVAFKGSKARIKYCMALRDIVWRWFNKLKKQTVL